MSAGRHSTRIEDERLLIWLKLRCEGIGSPDIAAEFRVRPEHVRTATTKVLHADLAESGEPPAVVRAAYWSPSPHHRRR